VHGRPGQGERLELPLSGADTRCAEAARWLTEPTAGTGAVASKWLCIEQPGPWGSAAPWDSGLDAEVAEELTRRAAAIGVRTVLIRRPGRHQQSVGRTVYLASTTPGDTWLRRATVSDPREVLDWRLSSDEVGEASEDLLLLVCTNGRRDVCCALTGRPLAKELAERHGNIVWESSHLGGHRFAPTVLLLPSGYSYGHMDAEACGRILAEATAGRVVVDRCRGRSTWSEPGQAAELALRAHLADFAVEAVTVVRETLCGADVWDVRLRHRHTAEWRVVVYRHASPPARPPACGVAPRVPTTISVGVIGPVVPTVCAAIT